MKIYGYENIKYDYVHELDENRWKTMGEGQ